MAYQRKDRWYQKAKEKGFKSRAAFKLMEINKKYRLLKPGMQVIDLGCAPGGWLQVASREIGLLGKIIGIDLEAIEGIEEKNISFVKGDINNPLVQQRTLAALGRKVDLILSDMAPHTTGIKFQDQYNSYQLAQKAFQCCPLFLREQGSFVVKIFPGEELEPYKRDLKPFFDKIQTFIPEATRKTSTEIYLIATGFRGPQKSEAPVT
ncbi:MAG: RlmE family RNA methyltransferase [Deltaproteobacteria bacterium]|nr:RlmE family RNA methyltransferase [Deltaproteobacteria bacterium]